MATYQDSKGKTYKTKAEAKASNVSMGTAKGGSNVAGRSTSVGGFNQSNASKAKNGTTPIPMTALQPTDVANIPDKPVPVDYGAVAPPTPVTTSTVEQGFQNNQNWLNTALQSAYTEVGTGESRLAKLEKDNQLKQKEQAVNNATEQLNQIVAKQQQDLISTRGTASANGVTEAVYGGQAATINREAALQALPVQAQLAAAQNNLEMAQTHIDRMYAIQSQDAQAKYQYKTKVIESIYNYANASQQRQLDQLNIQESRKYDEKKTNIAYQRDLAAQAREYGQTSLMGSIMRLDPNSPTYTQDLANAASGLSKPVTATNRDTAFDSAGNLVDMQTGEIITKATGGATTEKQEQLNNALSIAKELRLDTAVGKSGAVGFALQKFVPFGQSVGLQPNRAAYEARVDTLKANLTLDNLKLLKGAMSDKDLAFLQAVGSSLNTNMSETEFNKELDKVITKLESAGGVTTSSTGYALTKKGVSFDVNKAKQAGYTDAEIQAYLATN